MGTVHCDNSLVDDIPKKKIVDENNSMWAIYGDNAYTPCKKAVNKLPAAQYIIRNSSNGPYFQQRNVELDELILLPDSEADFVLNEIKDFWTKEKQYKDFNYVWKRGILLYGPPGSGKTSTLQFLSKMIIERDGLAIYVDNGELASEALRQLRTIEPKRPIIIMMEELDTLVQGGVNEQSILALLDGELQIENVVTVATTNYPEKLDKRIKNRPSRFDIVKKIGYPNFEARKKFLSIKLRNSDVSEQEISYWAENTNDYSIAHLKELILLTQVYKYSADAAIKRLNDMGKNNPSSSEDESQGKQNFGFTLENAKVRR